MPSPVVFASRVWLRCEWQPHQPGVASNPTDCADTGAATVTRAYNGADQPVTGANGQGSYVYDPLGRQTSIPAADTTKPANGAMSLAYYDSDAAQSVAQGDVKAHAGPWAPGQ